MDGKNAYFTVEAALVVPVVLSTMLLVIYLLLFQYNRCLLEQDLGAMLVWGSSIEVSDESLYEEKVRERIHKMYRDKYVAWEITTVSATLQKNNFSVKGGGQLTFPFSKWNFWGTENVWGTKMDYSCQRISPVTFIRLCRKARNGMTEDSKGNENNIDSIDSEKQ